MAVPRAARVETIEEVGPDSRILELAVVGGGPLGFVGGQYVIVDSGIDLPNGRVAKRAYSICSADATQDRLTLAVRRIGAGPGSNFMLDRKPGDVVPFSGPWGKFLPPEGPDDGGLLIVATDTGITAAMGLLLGERFGPFRERTRLRWWRESAGYFLPEGLVRERLPEPARAGFAAEPFPPAGNPGRAETARERIDRSLAGEGIGAAYLAGDGAVLFPLRERLTAAGVPAERIRLECYFNNPAKKAT